MESDMDFHQRDRYYLGGFHADFDSLSLQKEYAKYRSAWSKSEAVGGLPLAINMMLAVKYPKMAKPEPVEETNSKPKPKAKVK